MALFRYIQFLPPALHINGKFAPYNYKCSPQASTDTNGNAFYYGYKHKKVGISRYAYRLHCRNLSISPYSTSEQSARALWRDTLINAGAAYDPKNIPPALWQDFQAQKKYKNTWTFAVAKTYENNGIFPY